ncbi:DNA sulfur modification protein DndB [Georgenia sp. MJ173]|uniref:DNA sulfur modification protein DndB n=1 Tax=Georgenia sunbinii TaxID=3117728 RepID=UPI002F263D02
MAEELHLSGYDDRRSLLAQRYTRAGRSVYVVALPLRLISTHLPIPDPEKPFEGNRRVNLTHARKFGQYWRANQEWVSPPLLLDTLAPLLDNFDPKYAAGGVEVGVLKLPYNTAGELDILDGQHRILGWKLIADTISDDLKKSREQLERSKRAEDPVGIQYYEGLTREATRDQERLGREYVTLEILEGLDAETHKQYFSDIAVNAKGITKSTTVSFDQRQIANRVTTSIVRELPILRDRVDFERDRVMGQNESWLGAKNVSDIVKHVALGMSGRATSAFEVEANETPLTKIAISFFEALSSSFDDLEEMAQGDIDPVELRNRSLLGSVTIVRVLAGAYHDLAVRAERGGTFSVSAEGDARARLLFEKLAPHMDFPVSAEWQATGYFAEDAKAPSSRAQDLKGLSSLIATWGSDGRPFVQR